MRTDQPNSPVPRVSLRPKDAALALGISERLLWEKTKSGEIPHCRLGRLILYPVRDLQDYLSRLVNEQERPSEDG